jgi:two-component system invasion response regulator UvrY
VLSVLITDDNERFRRAVSASLDASGAFTVVGEAGDGLEAIALVDQLRPNMVLMDVSMPGMDGVEATRRIRVARPDAAVVLTSSLTVDEVPDDAWTCGAIGYIPKDELTAGCLEELYRNHGPDGGPTPRH